METVASGQVQWNSMVLGLGVIKQTSNAHFTKNIYDKPDKNKVPFSKDFTKH